MYARVYLYESLRVRLKVFLSMCMYGCEWSFRVFVYTVHVSKVCVHVFAYLRIPRSIREQAHIYVYVNTHVHVCTYACVPESLCVYVHACLYACVCECVCVCAYLSACVSVCCVACLIVSRNLCNSMPQKHLFASTRKFQKY